MTRRSAVILFALLPLAGWRISGCGERSLDELVRVLGSTVATLAMVSGNQQFAAKIKNDTDAVIALIQTWHEGQSAAGIIRAINQLIDDIKLLPVPQRLRPLITFALGTLANIIDKMNARGGNGEKPHTDIKLTDPPEKEKDFRKGWDAIRAGSPDMHDAPVI
jgi:hypothetical protein